MKARSSSPAPASRGRHAGGGRALCRGLFRLPRPLPRPPPPVRDFRRNSRGFGFRGPARGVGGFLHHGSWGEAAAWSGTTAGTYAADYSDQDAGRHRSGGAGGHGGHPVTAYSLPPSRGAGPPSPARLVTVSAAGTYFGSAAPWRTGRLVVDAGGDASDVRLVLAGVDHHLVYRAPPCRRASAGRVVVTLADGLRELPRRRMRWPTLYGDAATGGPDAALFGNDDLTINGTRRSLTGGALDFHDGIRRGRRPEDRVRDHRRDRGRTTA